MPPLDQKKQKETAMIQIGSKEEVALLLALFGTHTQNTQTQSKPSKRRGK
jgi:hypothetical protein